MKSGTEASTHLETLAHGHNEDIRARHRFHPRRGGWGVRSCESLSESPSLTLTLTASTETYPPPGRRTPRAAHVHGLWDLLHGIAVNPGDVWVPKNWAWGQGPSPWAQGSRPATGSDAATEGNGGRPQKRAHDGQGILGRRTTLRGRATSNVGRPWMVGESEWL